MNMQQIQQMMKQAEKMQSGMTKAKEEVENKEFTATVGGGTVTVVAKGTKEIQSINIKEELLDPEEKEMLEDLIKMAINQINKEIDEEMNDKMGPLAKGLPL